MVAFLYTLPDCEACHLARRVLTEQRPDLTIQEVPLDNPLVEEGVKILFEDGQVHAPVVVIPDEGIYRSTPRRLVLIHSLKEA